MPAGPLAVYLVAGADEQTAAWGGDGLYQRIEDFSLHILAAILISNLLTAVAMWYEIYYVVDDSTAETIKAILLDAAASVAVAILITGTVETCMVLHKLILEKYLNNRFIAGVAENDEKWRAWYNRMLEARARGEEFDEPPPESPKKKS